MENASKLVGSHIEVDTLHPGKCGNICLDQLGNVGVAINVQCILGKEISKRGNSRVASFANGRASKGEAQAVVQCSPHVVRTIRVSGVDEQRIGLKQGVCLFPKKSISASIFRDSP